MKPETETRIKDKIMQEVSPRKYKDLANELGVGVRTVKIAISRLREDGYSFVTEGDVFVRSKTTNGSGYTDLSKILPHRDFMFGVVSDSHLGSKKERVHELEAMYETFDQEGITVVVHAGDMTDGVKVYRGQENEVHKFSQDDQVEYAVKTYPKRKGIKTYFINGNHDLRAYEMGGIDPGKPIALQRPDMEYIGQATADVLLPGNIKMELLHPDGGAAYALSYKGQRDINNRAVNAVPDILVYGHYHCAYYMHYRDIHFIQAPCFKDMGIWEKRKGLNPTIGGWIVDVKLTPDHEKIQRFTPNLFTF